MSQISEQDKTTDELKIINLGSGPTARLVDFTPQEFVPSAKLWEEYDYDGVIVADENCGIASRFGEAYAGEGDVARLVCKRCFAHAETTGFGGGPINPCCSKAPKLVEKRPRSG